MKRSQFIPAIVFAVALSACTDKESLKVEETPSDFTKTITTATSVVTYTSESSFVSSLSSYGLKNPSQLSLNRIGTKSGYNSVYGFNIPAANQVTGFKWNSGDEATTDWRPQGITGFTWGSKKYLAVTWYSIGPNDIAGVHNEHKGVRLALVDITNMSNITYRLVLLVQNKANYNNAALYDKPVNPITQRETFIPVTMHAGGVAYSNQKLYIADTGLGLRVFDLNNFISAQSDPTKNTIGKETNGDLKAFDYGYILPQSGYYKMTNASPFSFVSLGTGATSSDKRLWTGQYKTSGTPQIFGYPISSTGVVTGPPTVVTPKDEAVAVVLNMQGVYRAGTKTFMSKTGNSSYLGSTARLVRYNDGATNGVRYRWPHGAEDLYLDSSTGYLWNLTEFETSKYGQDNRCVFAVRLSDYD